MSQWMPHGGARTTALVYLMVTSVLLLSACSSGKVGHGTQSRITAHTVASVAAEGQPAFISKYGDSVEYEVRCLIDHPNGSKLRRTVYSLRASDGWCILTFEEGKLLMMVWTGREVWLEDLQAWNTEFVMRDHWDVFRQTPATQPHGR